MIPFGKQEEETRESGECSSWENSLGLNKYNQEAREASILMIKSGAPACRVSQGKRGGGRVNLRSEGKGTFLSLLDASP